MTLAFRVNPCRLSHACIDGTWTSATNDLGVASGEFLIDADFLASLPTLAAESEVLPVGSGEELLRGKTQMAVVGFLDCVSLAVHFDAGAAQSDDEPMDVLAEKLYIVQNLPVPLHVTHKHIAPPPQFAIDGEHWPSAAAFAEPYCSHPHWQSDHAHNAPRSWSAALRLPVLAYNGDAASERRAIKWMLLGAVVIGGILIALSHLLAVILQAIMEPLGDLVFGQDTCEVDEPGGGHEGMAEAWLRRQLERQGQQHVSAKTGSSS